MRDVAQLLGVTPSRVSQIEKQASLSNSADDEQLVSWQEKLTDGRPPTGMTSLGVDAEAGVPELVLRTPGKATS